MKKFMVALIILAILVIGQAVVRGVVDVRRMRGIVGTEAECVITHNRVYLIGSKGMVELRTQGKWIEIDPVVWFNEVKAANQRYFREITQNKGVSSEAVR